MIFLTRFGFVRSLALSLILAGCATQMPAPIHHTEAPSTKVATPAPGKQPLPPAKPEQIPKQYGGYYADDGPIMDVPYDLDALPEPVPKAEELNRYANKPYTVLGQSFTPLGATTPYMEEGIASWYGRKFNGKNTSSGERYDMFKLTAAHPTLPIPSYARVTNLENGKTVVVRINDRGPFKKSRVMDMSYAAAYRLGYNNKGSARVRVEAIIPGTDLPPVAPVLAAAPAVAPAPKTDIAPSPVAAEPIAASPSGSDDPLLAMADSATAVPAAPALIPTQPPVATAIAPVTDAGLWLQIAAFGSQAAADTLRARLAAEWNGAVQPAVVASGKVWRVRLGPFASDAEANKAATRIASAYSVRPMVVR